MSDHAELPHADHDLVAALRSRLAEAADPDRAAAQQSYMKSEMPYWGVPAPGQRRIFKAVFADHPLGSREAWRDTVLLLWRTAGRREERYAAIALARHAAYRDYQTRETLPMYEEMIVTGAWWDYVDTLAAHQLGNLLRRYPPWMRHRMRQWSRHPHLWKRRAAILCQLGFKANTDLELLYDCIEPSLDDPDFFARKAIGWALRTYADIDPQEVARYVEANADRLSPLSKKEALRKAMKAGLVDPVP